MMVTMVTIKMMVVMDVVGMGAVKDFWKSEN